MAWLRTAARMLMPQLFQYGFAANAAIQELRHLGYGYRRSQMLQDFRSVSGKMRLQDTVEALSPDVRPGKSAMVETVLRQPERSYRIFGEVDIYDWDERKWMSKKVSFYDDYLRTKDEWSSEFVRQFGGNYAKYGQSIQAVNITAIEHNKGHLY